MKAPLISTFQSEDARNDEELIRILMITLTVMNLRPCDLTMNNRIRLLYVTAGDRFLRADGGAFQMYNTMLGSWDSFAGVVSEAILASVQTTLLHVGLPQ